MVLCSVTSATTDVCATPLHDVGFIKFFAHYFVNSYNSIKFFSKDDQTRTDSGVQHKVVFSVKMDKKLKFLHQKKYSYYRAQFHQIFL